MDTPSPAIRDLARRLLSLETTGLTATDAYAAEVVSEKLRITLTRFAGADGFLALMRRSVALARLDVPLLKTITVKSNGSIEGFDDLVTANGDIDEAGTAVTTHFLGLLVTFVGESLAFRLIREAWPDLPVDQ